MASDEDISQQEKRLSIYRHNLAHYLSQQAMQGEAHVSAGIANGIKEARSEIRRIKRVLQEWKVDIENHPDDEESGKAMRTSSFVNSTIETPSLAPIESQSEGAKGMTIIQAIKKVMQQAGHPLTIPEVYEHILREDLYHFKAANPPHIVATQIRRHCRQSTFATANKVKVKHFEQYPGNKYYFLDPPIVQASKNQLQNTRIRKIKAVEGSANKLKVSQVPSQTIPSSARPEKTVGEGQIIIGYHRSDLDYLRRFQVHLKNLGKRSDVTYWETTDVMSSPRRRAEIERKVTKARVVVILVSADFIATDFTANNDEPSILAVAASNGATILPVVIDYCGIHRNKSLSQFQPANDAYKPLRTVGAAKRDYWYNGVVDMVDQALKDI